jgi:hypothetical protein
MVDFHEDYTAKDAYGNYSEKREKRKKNSHILKRPEKNKIQRGIHESQESIGHVQLCKPEKVDYEQWYK